MEMNNYEVTWKEDHSVEVTAANETEAFMKAAEYAQEHDTRVDEDEYECHLIHEETETEEHAVATRDALNMKRTITIDIMGTAVVIEDYLNHPIESCSRMHKTVLDTSMFDELVRQFGYVKPDDTVEKDHKAVKTHELDGKVQTADI
ncbi:MAG: hypothetical protein J7K40_12195 [candidate division Zixibacteria bacterium]|nr:hypothetical protein [candidate division Zixibacteria bacterium]